MLSAIIASAWEETPLTFLIIYAGFKSIPSQIYEAASVDGLGGFSMLKNITFPMAKPSLALMTSFRSFDLVYMFAINGPFLYVQTLPYLLYQVSFVSSFQQYGSAISLLIMLIALVPTFLLLRMMKIDERLGLKKEKEKKKNIFATNLNSLFKARKGSFSSNRLASLISKEERKERRRGKRSFTSAIIYGLLSIAALLSIFPFYWTFATSLKTYDELFPSGGGIVLFPSKIDLSNWVQALR